MKVYTNRKYPWYGVFKGERNFVPIYDSTDHFHFACEECRQVARVNAVERRDDYVNTPTIYFYLECRVCGAKWQRKIYLEDTGKHFMQIPLTTEILANDASECGAGIITEGTVS